MRLLAGITSGSISILAYTILVKLGLITLSVDAVFVISALMTAVCLLTQIWLGRRR